jgi:catechol 2,3-dioxygenase-like lactoylglutathione lyase family enzyme
MPVQLNHTIVLSPEPKQSAEFVADILGLPAPTRFGPFHVVELANGASLDFMKPERREPSWQHYAFLVGEDEFDRIFGRIQARGLDYWADPGQKRAKEVNRNDGGRGVYFEDPEGRLLEIITRPYGSGA